MNEKEKLLYEFMDVAFTRMSPTEKQEEKTLSSGDI